MSLNDIAIIGGVLGVAYSITMLVAVINIWKLVEQLVSDGRQAKKK